jgi:hypothetical protein
LLLHRLAWTNLVLREWLALWWQVLSLRVWWCRARTLAWIVFNRCRALLSCIRVHLIHWSLIVHLGLITASSSRCSRRGGSGSGSNICLARPTTRPTGASWLLGCRGLLRLGRGKRLTCCLSPCDLISLAGTTTLSLHGQRSAIWADDRSLHAWTSRSHVWRERSLSWLR